MDCRSLGLVFFDQEDRHGGQQHEYPGERQHVGRIGGEAVLDDGTAGQSETIWGTVIVKLKIPMYTPMRRGSTARDRMA